MKEDGAAKLLFLCGGKMYRIKTIVKKLLFCGFFLLPLQLRLTKTI